MNNSKTRKATVLANRSAAQSLIRIVQEEFNPQKYEEAKSMSLVGWCNLLFDRSSMLRMYRKVGSSSENMSIYLAKLAGDLLLHPFSAKTLDVSLNFGGEGYKPVKELSEEHIHSVDADFSILLREDKLEMVICKEVIDIVRQRLELGVDESYHEAVSEAEKYPGSFGHACVLVDLASSDEDLVKEFQSWLEAKRMLLHENAGRQGLSKRVAASDCISWVEKGAIQYLDLKIFCRLTGIELTNYQMGNLIFPDELDIDVSERIRKVTAPLAKKISDPDFLNSLQVSAIQLENSRRNEN